MLTVQNVISLDSAGLVSAAFPLSWTCGTVNDSRVDSTAQRMQPVINLSKARERPQDLWHLQV